MNSWIVKDSLMYAALSVGMIFLKLLSYVSSEIIFGTNDKRFTIHAFCKLLNIRCVTIYTTPLYILTKPMIPICVLYELVHNIFTYSISHVTNHILILIMGSLNFRNNFGKSTKIQI